MTINTLSLARELRGAELNSVQAEAIGRAISESSATKADLRDVRSEVIARIEQLEARVDAKIEQLRSSMLLWFIGTIITLAAVMIAALKL